MNCMSGATKIASPSARCSEMRFGTSSPRISDAYVKQATNMASAMPSACRCDKRPGQLREPVAQIVDDLLTAVGGAEAR